MLHRAFALVVAFGVLVGCSSPPWTVIRQSSPSALRDHQKMTVQVSSESLTMAGEPLESWLAARPEKERTSMQEVIQQTGEGFRVGVDESLSIELASASGPPTPDELRLTAHLVDIIKGKYAVMYSSPSTLRARLVWTVGDVVVDEIETQISVAASVYKPAVLQRMKECGRRTGRRAAKYFESARSR